jgi:hypothetical protein
MKGVHGVHRVRRVHRVRGVLLALALSVVSGSSLVAQHEGHPPPRPQTKTEQQPQPEKVLGWEPIRCWRQSTSGAVTIGETFTVVLTCAVYEGDNAQVMPDESRLGVAAIQMAPFELLGGSHPPDVRRASRRFFQYDYQLRIISPDTIGNDVNIPPLTISYRIHSRVGAAATLEGRDLSYVLPMMPIKVLSLVPADAADIRDGSEASLAAVESLRFRSNLFRVITFVLAALAAVMMVLALVPLARGRTGEAGAERNRLPDRIVLDRAAADLGEVQSRAAHEGWTDDLIARAMGSLRLIAAAAIGHPISHKPADKGSEGRLLVRHRSIRAVTNVAVSSSVTADEVARARERQPSAFSTSRHQQLEGLQAGLASLTAALYRRESPKDSSALDEVVRHAQGVAKDVASERSWLKTQWARR